MSGTELHRDTSGARRLWVRKVWRQLRREAVDVARHRGAAHESHGLARPRPRETDEDGDRRQGDAVSTGQGE
jgi:hypothetical protein